eukprot:scaffold103637_cov32-Tisochrysis_lutea.AAC.2
MGMRHALLASSVAVGLALGSGMIGLHAGVARCYVAACASLADEHARRHDISSTPRHIAGEEWEAEGGRRTAARKEAGGAGGEKRGSQRGKGGEWWARQMRGNPSLTLLPPPRNL